VYKKRYSGGNNTYSGRSSQFRRPQRGSGGGRNKQRIDPARFINRSTKAVTEVAYESKHSFADFELLPVLQANLDSAGFKQPSPIQDIAIPLALAGRDVIGLANTGTGKTAAFLLPILNQLYRSRVPQSVLIVAPTRELAQQIDAEFKKFAQGMKLYSAVCVGGMSINTQMRELRRSPHIVIGTPGRLKDLFGRGVLRPNNMTTLVLDEVDRMLDMGFVHDVRSIVKLLPETGRQTLCFSATLSNDIQAIIHEFVHDPETVSVRMSETNEHIYQDVVHFRDDMHKKEILLNLLRDEAFEKVIVFGETKHGVQRLSESLTSSGITACAIHGNKTQSQRMKALASFQRNESKVLVATDVAARGLDIPSVSHVINFDQPQTYDDYIHRIGRTGRAGKSGTALTFVKL